MELLVTQPDDALTTSREVRERHAGRTEVLDKVRALKMLPGDTYVTTEMVAAYYEVGVEAIKTLTKDNRAELESDGYDVIEGAQLRSFKDLSGIGGRARSLALFPRRAVLRLGMLLRDSTVARQVRDYLLNAEAAALPDLNTTDGQIEVLQRMLAVAQRNKVLELQNTQQAKELESARPQVAYVSKFVDATGDVSTVKAYGAQVGMSEKELRGYLEANKVIFRKECWRITSKGNRERVWQWVARPKYRLWFTPKDQPDAPRLHNGQMQQTLYVNAVGKQRIAELLQAKPPALFDAEANR
jgi:hypothetical protein